MEVQASFSLIKSTSIKGIAIKRSFTTLFAFVLLFGVFQVFSLSTGVFAYREIFSIWPGELGNQAEGAAGGSFYLITEPGEEQQISVRVVNLTDEYRTIEVSIHLATTDNQGSINYWGSDEPADTTLPHNIEDLLVFEPYIILEPNEEAYFWVTVRVPSTPYQGVLAGGLVFRLAEDSLYEEENLIVEERLLAVLLRQDGFVESNIVLEGITTEVLGGQSVINAHLRNVAANFVGQMRITTQIRDHTGEVVFTNVRENIDMAPNSSFHYELGLDDLQMSTEMYEVTFLMESGPILWERVTLIQGTGTLLEEPEPEPIQEEEESVEPEEPELLDEESLFNILLFLMIIGGIFLVTLIVVSIVRSNRSKSDNFEELQGQILATLMSDEEGKARSTKVETKSIRKDKAVPSKGSEIEEILIGQEEFEDGGSFDKEQEKRIPKKDKEIKPVVKETLTSSKLEETDKEESLKSGEGKRDTSPKEKEIEQKEKELEKKVKVLERKAKEIEKKEKSIVEKEKSIVEKEKSIVEKEKTIVAKEKSIEEIAKTIEDKAKTIEDKVKTIEDKVKTMEELEKEVERKEREHKERVAARKKKKLPVRKKEEWDIEI